MTASPIAYVAADGHCPACRSTRLRHLFADASDAPGQRVSVRECLACGLAWQFPPGRSARDSVAHFKARYEEGGDSVSSYFAPARKAQIADMQVQFLGSLGAPTGRLLEVGAGAGFFAAAAAGAGWQVTAVDPALSVSPELNLAGTRLLRGSPDELEPSERFDVIALWDVIEHLTDPAAVLADLRPRLSPGGWLIVETGNYRCADRVSEGHSHWIYALDHRWYFSPDTLAALLRELGFAELRLAPGALRPGWLGPAQYGRAIGRRAAAAIAASAAAGGLSAASPLRVARGQALAARRSARIHDRCPARRLTEALPFLPWLQPPGSAAKRGQPCR